VSKAGLGILGWSKIGATRCVHSHPPRCSAISALRFLMIGCSWCLRKADARPRRQWFRRLQFLSRLGLSLNTVGNRRPETMGIIAVLLLLAGAPGKSFPSTTNFPLWKSCCRATPPWASGTMAGGWRIVKTMGMRLNQATSIRRLLRRDRRRLPFHLPPTLESRCPPRTTITGAIVGVALRLHTPVDALGPGQSDSLGLGIHHSRVRLVAAITYFIRARLGA